MQKNKTVNFVGVIDNRGKLLCGQSSTKNCITCMKSGEAINSSSSRNALSFCGPKNEASQFFSNCLVPVIKLSTNADSDATNKAHKLGIIFSIITYRKLPLSGTCFFES
jgi:hypothetical protein